MDDVRRDVLDLDADLVRRVAVAHGDAAVLDRVEVDRDAERRADLVLAPVAPPDVPGRVPLHVVPPLQVVVDAPRDLEQRRVLLREREDGGLDGRQERRELEQRPLGAADLVDGVSFSPCLDRART